MITFYAVPNVKTEAKGIKMTIFLYTIAAISVTAIVVLACYIRYVMSITKY